MFGPLHIKLNRKTLKEAQVVIFTCMTSRAVHLELVNDKTADAFLMAFRRFASLRGHQVEVGKCHCHDGLVRKARIKTHDSEYDRPIHKLCLIATKDELNADRSR